MVIIDKEHDYYDFACAYVDRSVYYDRRNKDVIRYAWTNPNIKAKEYLNTDNAIFSFVNENTYFRYIVPIVVIVGRIPFTFYSVEVYEMNVGYTHNLFETFKEAIVFYTKAIEKKSITEDDISPWYNDRENVLEDIRKRISSEDIYNILDHTKVPVAVVQDSRFGIFTNPILRLYKNLPDIIPADLAYRLVEEELMRQNDPSNRMVQLDDEKLAEKHGFGHKYAFRKEKK